jgi:hypothetical protein
MGALVTVTASRTLPHVMNAYPSHVLACLRCERDIASCQPAYMVMAKVVLRVYYDSLSIYSFLPRPVCTACYHAGNGRAATRFVAEYDEWTNLAGTANAIPELNQPTEGTCRACGRELIACKHWRQWVCSDACRMRVRRAKRRTAKPRQSCTVCGKRFAARRSDARTCSPACRQRAYRDRAELTARLGNNHDGKQRFGKNAVRHLGAAALLFRATGKTTRPHKPVMPLRPGFAKKNMSSATRLRTRRCCGARVTAGHLPSAVQHA